LALAWFVLVRVHTLVTLLVTWPVEFPKVGVYPSVLAISQAQKLSQP